MKVTSNLAAGQVLDPGPLARLLAESVYLAIKAERGSLADGYEEDEDDGSRESYRVRRDHAVFSG